MTKTFKTKKEILDFIAEYNLPLYPISGILAYTFIPELKSGDIYLPENYKKSSIRSGEVLTGIIVSDPLNCEAEPLLKKEQTILYKAASGVPLNINGHQFHKLECNEILAILQDD